MITENYLQIMRSRSATIPLAQSLLNKDKGVTSISIISDAAEVEA